MTTFQEWHRWRGFNKAGGPLASVWVVGFFTVGVMHWSLSRTLPKMADVLKQILEQSASKR